MTTSQIHQTYGLEGLFNGVDHFELTTFRAELKARLIAERKEFLALINSAFQGMEFSYRGAKATLKEYQKQCKARTLYKKLLKLYLNKKLRIETAFMKAIALMEKHDVSIPKLNGYLSRFCTSLKEALRAEMIEQRLEAFKNGLQEIQKFQDEIVEAIESEALEVAESFLDKIIGFFSSLLIRFYVLFMR